MYLAWYSVPKGLSWVWRGLTVCMESDRDDFVRVSSKISWDNQALRLLSFVLVEWLSETTNILLRWAVKSVFDLIVNGSYLQQKCSVLPMIMVTKKLLLLCVNLIHSHVIFIFFYHLKVTVLPWKVLRTCRYWWW